jgi:hypothetical protein
MEGLPKCNVTLEVTICGDALSEMIQTVILHPKLDDFVHSVPQGWQ